MATVLCKNGKENKAVQTVLKDLHPSERIRPIFCDRSHTYREFKNLCVYPHSIQMNEASGQPDPGSQSPSSARDFRFHLSGTTRTRSHLLCYNCNMSGHD